MQSDETLGYIWVGLEVFRWIGGDDGICHGRHINGAALPNPSYMFGVAYYLHTNFDTCVTEHEQLRHMYMRHVGYI